MTVDRPSDNERGFFLGAVLSGIAISPFIVWALRDYTGITDVEKGLWAIYMGFLLAISYVQPHRSILFRGIMKFFEFFHAPRGRRFSLLYAGAFLLMGLWILASTLLYA